MAKSITINALNSSSSLQMNYGKKGMEGNIGDGIFNASETLL